MIKKLEDFFSDDELNAAVAFNVAGWVKYVPPETGGRLLLPYRYFDATGKPHIAIAPYATSADAVLPLLEKWASEAEFNGPHIHMTPDSRWLVSLHNADDIVASATARTLPRAICIAMLQAKGIEVIIT